MWRLTPLFVSIVISLFPFLFSDRGKREASKQRKDAPRRHTDLVAWVVDYAAREYDDQWKTFIALDAKAQGTAAVGGILIAALVTLSGRDSFIHVSRLMRSWLLVPLVVSMLCIFLSLVFSVISLLVRQMEKPYDTDAVLTCLDDVSSLPSEELNEDTISTFYRELIGRWKDLVATMDPLLERKANGLQTAQWFLFVALILAMVILGEVTIVQAA